MERGAVGEVGKTEAAGEGGVGSEEARVVLSEESTGAARGGQHRTRHPSCRTGFRGSANGTGKGTRTRRCGAPRSTRRSTSSDSRRGTPDRVCSRLRSGCISGYTSRRHRRLRRFHRCFQRGSLPITGGDGGGGEGEGEGAATGRRRRWGWRRRWRQRRRRRRRRGGRRRRRRRQGTAAEVTAAAAGSSPWEQEYSLRDEDPCPCMIVGIKCELFTIRAEMSAASSVLKATSKVAEEND